MSKFRRQLMMASNLEPIPPLPYDAEVEWLEGTGTQYIDSGIIGTSNVTVDIVCSYPKSSGSVALGFIWGSRIGINNAEYGLIHSYIKNYRFAKTNSQDWVANTDYILRFTNTEQANQLKGFDLNGDLIVSLNATFASFNSNKNIYIFAMNANGTPNIGSGIKIYSFKLYENGNIVRDYKPVRVGTVGYLYDAVSRTLFSNSGTGNFLLGNDKN